MKGSNSSQKNSNKYALPDAFEDYQNTQPEDKHLIGSGAMKEHLGELGACEAEPPVNDEEASAESDDFEDETSDDEEAETVNKGSRAEPDMNEDFELHARIAEEQVEEMQKRRYELEMKINSIDPNAKKVKFFVRCHPIVKEMFKLMAEQLGVKMSDIIEASVVMFYLNHSDTSERRMLNHIG